VSLGYCIGAELNRVSVTRVSYSSFKFIGRNRYAMSASAIGISMSDSWEQRDFVVMLKLWAGEEARVTNAGWWVSEV